MLRLMDRAVTEWHIPIIGEEKGRVLRRLLARAQAPRGIEVGSLFGYSAILIGGQPAAAAAASPASRQNPYLARFVAEQRRPRRGSAAACEVVAGDALRVLPLLRGPVDFLLLDAKKEDYLDYLRAVEPRLRQGRARRRRQHRHLPPRREALPRPRARAAAATRAASTTSASTAWKSRSSAG